MHFIKQIFNKRADDTAHQRFVKYSRGEYEGAAVELKRQGNAIRVKGSIDYANVLGELIAENADTVFRVDGRIISKRKILDELKGLGIGAKARKKVRMHVSTIKCDLSPGELKGIYDAFKDCHILLNLTPVEKSNWKLRTKNSIPKPGDPVDAEFCSATLDISILYKVMDEICFDVEKSDFREIKITHTYKIKELVIPEEYKNDPANARIFAKRKGEILRLVDVNGKLTENSGELFI